MMRRIARIATSRAATIAMGLLLATVSLGGITTTPASAAGSIVSWWQPAGGGTAYENNYSCSAQNDGLQGHPLEVYNACGGRVWLHYDDAAAGAVYSYCVNPGGFLAYGFNDSGGWLASFGKVATDIQVTANTSPCDAGPNLDVTWLNGNGGDPKSYHCEGQAPVSRPAYSVFYVGNGCLTRVWLHQTAAGTGNTACVSPGSGLEPSPSDEFLLVQETPNQAPCSAGGPPYSY
jgi:hypothetical protein